MAIQLKRLCEKEGLTQATLAYKTKLSLGYIAPLEQGRHDPPLSTWQGLRSAEGDFGGISEMK
jgi:predicted transcriptional regulator